MSLRKPKLHSGPNLFTGSSLAIPLDNPGSSRGTHGFRSIEDSTPALSEVFEKIGQKCIYSCFEANKPFNACNPGFIKKDSTTSN